MKKRKKKNKKNYYVIMFCMLILIMSIAITVINKVQKDNLLKEIKSHYNNLVLVSKNAKLYNKKHEVVGKVENELKFALTKENITDVSQQYFNINDTEYYVFYNDIKPVDYLESDSINDKYVTFNQNVQTNLKTNFYRDDQLVLTLDNEVNLPIEYTDFKYYYVKYLDYILQIKKDADVKINDNNNTDLKETEYVSILHFDTIYKDEKCTKNTCIKYSNFEKYIDYLEEEGYYSITLEEYEKYLDEEIRLKEKAILLTTNHDNEIVMNWNKNSDYQIQLINENVKLKFKDSNKKTTKDSNKTQLDRYIIKSNTTMSNFKKMVAGKTVVEIVYVNEQKIPVLNYHFFYDPLQGEACNQSICLDVKNFREQLTYLKENGFKTLTMDEFTRWMYKEIELPKKSVLITIDDGAMGTGKHNGNKLIPILEEFDMNATLFLISGWWDVSNYVSDKLDIQSHTYDMHNYGSCGKGQVVCNSKASVVADLKKSLSIVDNNNSFCFPFYSYSDTAIEAVKEAGFKLAFIGGNRKAGRSDNKYLVPRYPIYKNTSLERFKSIVG